MKTEQPTVTDAPSYRKSFTIDEVLVKYQELLEERDRYKTEAEYWHQRALNQYEAYKTQLELQPETAWLNAECHRLKAQADMLAEALEGFLHAQELGIEPEATVDRIDKITSALAQYK